MRKIININFQGRVIPIEELAYDILKQYIESLRVFFANEEGRDEIINDIEGRIAELFSETLKKGAACITESDVNVVINSIGRPEDFDDEETRVKEQLKGEEARQRQSGGYSSQFTTEPRGPRLFRDQEDKILGGVCAGLASYFRIDPAIVRILFAVITLGGFGAGVPLYILLWIVLPIKKLDRSVISKRLYRNPDDKVIAGVASGVAAYFNVAVWIPRMVFAFPLVLAVLGSIWRNLFWDHFSMPTSIIFSSFGSTFFLVYAILWIVIPEANSASEKLEMRGEKVDLNSIKNTIQEDLGSFKQKAEKWGEEFKEKAQQWSDEVNETFQTKGKQFGKEAAAAGANAGNRFGQAIGIAFKAFFLFIAGIIVFTLVLGLIAILVSGVNVAPLKTFFLHGFWQNALALTSLILFIGSPIVAMVIWLIRRITRVRSKNNYLGYTFGGLWTIGLIAAVFLAASITKDYRSRTAVEENVTLSQPSRGKLLVKVDESRAAYYGEDFWLGINWDNDDAPFVGMNKDSLLIKSVQVRIMKSADSSFHTQVVKLSNGSGTTAARGYASAVNFAPHQTDDSVLVLPRGFVVTSDQKFHNQQVIVIIEVPVGKRIQLDESLSDYHYFNVNVNSHRRRYRQVTDWDDNWNNDFDWSKNVEYVMTENDGLKATHEKRQSKEDARKQLDEIEKQRKELDKKQEELERKLPVEDSSDIKNQEQVVAPATAGKNTAMENGEPELAPRPSGMLLMKFIR